MRRLIVLLVLVCGFTVPPLLSGLFLGLPDPDITFSQRPVPLKSFSFLDGSGEKLTLGRFHGRFVLVNVWATWCGPCQKEMPSLDRLAGLLGRNGATVVPISVDTSGASVVSRFYKEAGLDNLPIYVDPSKSVMDALRLTGIPTTLLIDPNGDEVARIVGPAQWDAPASVKQISEITKR